MALHPEVGAAPVAPGAGTKVKVPVASMSTVPMAGSVQLKGALLSVQPPTVSAETVVLLPSAGSLSLSRTALPDGVVSTTCGVEGVLLSTRSSVRSEGQ